MLLAVSGCAPARQALVQAGGAARSASGDRVTSWILALTATSAEPRPAIPARLRAALYAAAIASKHPGGAVLTLVVPARSPQTVDLTPLRGRRVEHSQRRRELDVEANLAALDRLVANQSAAVAGLDTTAVMQEAARADPTAAIEVLSSGVATQGTLSMLGNGSGNGWPQEDPSSLVDYLARKHYLPSQLAGRDVTFYYLGDVAGSQPPLTQPLRMGLQNLYLAICRRARARSCTLGARLPSGQPPLAKLRVPAVPVPKIVYRPDNSCQTTTSIPSRLLFAPDNAELSREADDVLRPIAEKVTSSAASDLPTATWIIAAIIGHTFDAGPGDGAQLSRLRARAVRQRLVELGVDRSMVKKVDGVGESQPAVPTYLPDGRRNPAAPELDRRVEVVMKLVRCPQA